MGSDRDAEQPESTVTLSAVSGAPLEDHETRGTVVACAQALAERAGRRITHLATTDRAIVVTLRASRLEAIGFATELRTITNTWYEGKYRDGPLWGTPAP
ncbi:MAG: hypothetical protein WCK33_10140 [Phycisphaerae bacterium]